MRGMGCRARYRLSFELCGRGMLGSLGRIEMIVRLVIVMMMMW